MKTKITKKEYKKRIDNDEPVFRSCWNCNGAHGRLRDKDYLIYCIWCNKLYLKGKEVEVIDDPN